MAQFLTAVTTAVDAYWMKVFEDSGLSEPRVGYHWIPPARPRRAHAATRAALSEKRGRVLPGNDTIYISQQFATDIYSGALDQALLGGAQGYGRTIGDFAVAYIVAHEYGQSMPAARAITAPPSSARRPGTAASSRATRLVQRVPGQDVTSSRGPDGDAWKAGLASPASQMDRQPACRGRPAQR